MLHLTKQSRIQKFYVARLQKFLRTSKVGTAFFGAVAKPKVASYNFNFDRRVDPHAADPRTLALLHQVSVQNKRVCTSTSRQDPG